MSDTPRHLPTAYLRAFVTLLVLAHHAVIAYLPGLPPVRPFHEPPLLWSAFPVVDPHQPCAGFGLFVLLNEQFFMALMFLLSGLFVAPRLRRKGAARFLSDRARRLGLPFVASILLLAPLAYYPSYRLAGGDPSLIAFARTWTSLPTWPAGPAWFLWVLLAFDSLAAALHRWNPDALDALAERAGRAATKPMGSFWGFVAATTVGYLALALPLGVERWLALGPFTVQGCRIALYALYFVAGLAIGAHGVDRGLLAADAGLVRRGRLWGLFALLGLILGGASLGAAGTLAGNVVGGIGYALSAASISAWLLALVIGRARQPKPLWDRLAQLAFGMYLTHYIANSFLQWAMLPAPLPGAVKGVIVFAAVIALSAGATAVLRRIPALRAIL